MLITVWNLIYEEGQESINTISVSSFDTPMWQDSGFIYIRSEREGSGSFLFKHLNSNEERAQRYGATLPSGQNIQSVGYRYDPVKNSLEPISEKEWDQANSTVADCGYDPVDEKDTLQRDNDGTLRHRGTLKPIVPIGKTVLQLRYSPNRTIIAILSSTGSRPEGVGWFGAPSGATGTHFVELFSLINGERIQKPFRLPIGGTSGSTLSICWSNDNRYLVCHDMYYFKLCILPVYRQEDGKR